MDYYVRGCACFSILLFLFGFVGCVIISPIISKYNNYISYDDLPYCSLLNKTSSMYSCTIYENCFCTKDMAFPACSNLNNTCSTDKQCIIRQNGRNDSRGYSVICNQYIGYYCYAGHYTLNNGITDFNVTILCGQNHQCINELPMYLDKCGYIDGRFYYSNPNEPQSISLSIALGILFGSVMLLLLSLAMFVYFAGCERCGRPSSVV